MPAMSELSFEAALGQRTVVQALADGIPCKTIWRAVWTALELPARDR